MAESIGKYLTVSALPRDGRKTDRFEVVSLRGNVLGRIQWYGRWRQYTFDPVSCTTFNRACLDDLARFLQRLNDEHRTKPKEGSNGNG